MSKLSIGQSMEQAIREYIRACNDADAQAISACFEPDAQHFFPHSKWSGAMTISDNFAKVVKERGRHWTIDQILTDEGRCAAVLEWSQFDRSPHRLLRGVDWFVFNKDSFLIKEVRCYLAARSDPVATRQELQDFDYVRRGYPRLAEP
jgi:methyltransferase